MGFVRVNDSSQFDEILTKTLATSSKPVFVFFFGTELEIGQSWCADCVISDPWVRSAAKTTQISLLEAPVGDREAWKGEHGADNFYRKQYKLTVVPTIIKFGTDGKEVARLEDQADCTNLTILTSFFKST